MPSGTPSASESLGQPLALTVAPAGVLGHLSSPSYTPSLSESVGQPRASTVAPSGVSGQASFLSGTPSLSESGGGPLPDSDKDDMRGAGGDRKSTRLNSSHSQISYAVFCLKKKKKSISHT